jgi:hypothetical protein
MNICTLFKYRWNAGMGREISKHQRVFTFIFHLSTQGTGSNKLHNRLQISVPAKALLNFLSS